MSQPSPASLLGSHPLDLRPYESVYKHLHSHPELSCQERNTAALAADHLAQIAGTPYEIHTAIGGHGLAGVLRNGEGKTVLLRADMDALPVEEKTGLGYASKVTMRDTDGATKSVMHACGHDMHVTCLLAAAERLAGMKECWKGTLIVLFQPNEERGGGAQGMVNGGLYERIPVPDVVLGQHVVAKRTGRVDSKVGLIMAASDSLRIRLYGRGGHASTPHKTIDPVVMAASVVMRLQTIVSREVDPSNMAVVTVGSLRAGETVNIIADFAELMINVRTIDSETREKVLASIRRIVKAECEASGAPQEPEIEQLSRFPATVNDPEVTTKLADSFGKFFGDVFDPQTPRMNFSEDFSILGTSQNRPCSFWFFGGTDEKIWDEAAKTGTVDRDIPMNHSPFFAPVIQPTMQRGVDALTLAALTFLTKAS